jgi:hypothetical protein
MTVEAFAKWGAVSVALVIGVAIAVAVIIGTVNTQAVVLLPVALGVAVTVGGTDKRDPP